MSDNLERRIRRIEFRLILTNVMAGISLGWVLGEILKRILS
jgi:hypothetical protein